MFSFVLSLLVLTAMFSVISGAAFLLRKTLLKGREGMMYPFWVIILLISIIPLKIDIPDLPAVPHFPEQTATESTELVYLGDYSEIERAEMLHSQKPTAPITVEMKHGSRLMLEARRFLAANGKHADMIAAMIFILWLAGAVISFSSSMITYVNTKTIMRAHSSACKDVRMRRLFEDCARRIGVRQSVELRVFDIESFCSPCVCGILRPALYLEPGCAKLSDRELSCVLIHELTHIRRFDVVHKLFCLIVTAVHWFNPSSCRVQSAMFEDCELACDYSVVRAFGNQISPLYMNTILDFVERFSEKNRLVGQSGIGGGLFISQPSGAAFLKRRFANMKNFRKDRLATILTGVFTAVCAAANVFVLSSCSGITPGMLSSAIDLTPPIEQMVRAHYGLSADDFITPDMVDGITSLKVQLNEQYEGHILVSFEVNGDNRYARPLPAVAYENYYDSVLFSAIEECAEQSNDPVYIDPEGKVYVSKDLVRFSAFYAHKDPEDPMLTERARQEMLSTFPELEETGAQYYLDPTITVRETAALYDILDRTELIEAWELDSYAFDCSSLAYFTNLSEVEFIGLTPIGYSFPGTIKVTIGDAEPTDDTDEADKFDRYIIEPETYVFTEPTDGSVIAIPDNPSLDFALREYFVMSSWDYATTPLTSKHLERITSIKAEIDDELTAILRELDGGALDQAVYVRYTINGYTLDIIPQYLADSDFEVLWQSLESTAPTISDLIKESYTWSDILELWILNEDVNDENKLAMFKAITDISLKKVALVGKTDSGAYITQFQSASSRSGGTPARLLDSADSFSDDLKDIFPNLTEWVNEIH